MAHCIEKLFFNEEMFITTLLFCLTPHALLSLSHALLQWLIWRRGFLMSLIIINYDMLLVFSTFYTIQSLVPRVYTEIAAIAVARNPQFHFSIK